ncbi:GvpL/GvpF family gas vesicle protein [Streptomyces sp. TRM66268-LWL]|uniref:GvpL/GvpF family gas vesicle protein n=1 Tax=Streptomyces polyasparticus TaxID=2767826 RepID=A0ABR7SCE4_9ACTN|nr:GvpL/GvpF family gas vesicle protein [Streptomyces polyasparticus]MBC9713150.1 GvpL/GvpF family gas vesicle protein [Streptomyces polyasparticus]
MGTYVYGIADAEHPGLPEGIDGIGNPASKVRVISGGGLAALACDAPDDLRPKRRDLLAHQHVLSEAGAAGTVLPMRFGSVAEDDEAVAATLAEHADHYRERLGALRDRVEYNVKVQHDEDAVLQLVVAQNAALRAQVESNRRAGGGSHEDKLRVGELAARAVQAQESADADMVREALAPVADAVCDAPQSTGWICNLSFLVDRATPAALADAVEELRQAHPHLVFLVNGPLPPYSFVDPDLAATTGR